MYVCMYVCMYVLGGACLIERVKRWLANCGEDCESRVGKLERPSAGRTRNLRVFFLFAFSLSIVLSERAKVNEAQEHRNDADRSGRHSAQNVGTASEKSMKNWSRIDENPCQVDQKLIENRSWAVLGARNRFRDASGRARDGFWTSVGRSWLAPAASRSAFGPHLAIHKPSRARPDASRKRF